MSEKLRIIFFGTPEFAAYSLKKVVERGFQIVAVVTATDKPAGRGMKLKYSAVKQAAIDLNIPVLQPANMKAPEFLEQLAAFKPDLGLVIAFRMMPESVWSFPRLGTFNLHASLLPDYRGAAPINHAIINGEHITGITTFFLKHQIDTGDILRQEKVAILPEDNAGTLHDKLMIAGAELVCETLEDISKGSAHPVPQEHLPELHEAHKLSRDFCRIERNLTVESTHNKVRGLSPYPGAWIQTNFGILKIYASAITSKAAVGNDLVIEDKKLLWPCSDFMLEILELQAEGKPKMDAKSFINGLINKR